MQNVCGANTYVKVPYIRKRESSSNPTIQWGQEKLSSVTKCLHEHSGGGAQKMLCFSIFPQNNDFKSHQSKWLFCREHHAAHNIVHAWVCGGSVMVCGGRSMEGQWTSTAPWLPLGIGSKTSDPLSDPILVQVVLGSWQRLASCSVQVLPIGWKGPHHWLPFACPKSSGTALGHYVSVSFVQENQ